MACCEIMYGSGVPAAPPAESHIPIYIDRTSKKVYYWNGTGWELIWEIATAGPGTPGVVSIDPNSPIKMGSDGTLQIDCMRLKQQCGFATADEVASVVTTTVNNLIQDITGDVTNLETAVTQIDQEVDSLTTRVTNIENWDLCAKTSGCGYDSGSGSGSGGGGGVTKLIAGDNITLNPPSGIGDVIISAAGGGGSGGGGVTPPPPPGPDGGVLDYGGWRIMMGNGNTSTGYLDEINFVAPFDGVFAINVTEGNAVGWGSPGAGNVVPAGPTVFGWTRHPTAPNTKFLISVARKQDDEFVYSGGITFSYIAYGKKP